MRDLFLDPVVYPVVYQPGSTVSQPDSKESPKNDGRQFSQNKTIHYRPPKATHMTSFDFVQSRAFIFGIWSGGGNVYSPFAIKWDFDKMGFWDEIGQKSAAIFSR